jgi:hypothetical protein
MERVDRLYNKLMDYFKKVAGPEYKYEKEAMRRLSQMRFEDLPTTEEDFESEIVTHLNRIHPQKCEYIGETAVNTLIQQGNDLAESNAISTVTGAAVLVMLMFFFGHGCLTDPQFPWIAGTLSNISVVNTNEKFERLYLGMTTFLKHELGSSEER